MELPTYVALSRLAAQQRALDVTASNLANASTPGFKASRVLFTDWLSAQTGTTAPAGDRKLSYTQDKATYRELQAGPIQNTSNPLDLAISGEGYFTVSTARGPRLTRAGHFTQLPNGTIGDMDGDALLSSTGAPLRIAPTDTNITVTADGTVSTESGEVGRIGVVTPSDRNRMTAEGNRNLRADVPTAAVREAKVLQGAVEDSNVQAVTETTRMMSDLRSFQFTTQFVQAESDRMQSAIDKITQRKS